MVFKVFPLDRVQQRRLPRNAFLSGLWSRSLTLFLVEVFLVHLLLTLQLVMKNAQLFPKIKKSAKLGSHSGSELLPESSPSTPAAKLKEEMEVLFAVPLQLRTPAQRARLGELISASSQARRRKRKKRRKRRTPRTSSLPGRARRRQRQWSACNAGFTGYDAPKDRCSGIYVAGIACNNAPRAVFSSLVRRPFPGLHGPDSAESCGVHTGAVLGRGCDHARCWATTRPHGTDSAETCGVPTGAVVTPVFPLDRVQQRRLPPRNAFLSGSWSRLWTIRPWNASLSGLMRRALSLHPRNAVLSGFWSRSLSLLPRNAVLSGLWSNSLTFPVEVFLLVFFRPHQLGLLMRALLVVAVVWARHVLLVKLHSVPCLLAARQVLLVKMPLVVLLLAARLVL